MGRGGERASTPEVDWTKSIILLGVQLSQRGFLVSRTRTVAMVIYHEDKTIDCECEVK